MFVFAKTNQQKYICICTLKLYSSHTVGTLHTVGALQSVRIIQNVGILPLVGDLQSVGILQNARDLQYDEARQSGGALSQS